MKNGKDHFAMIITLRCYGNIWISQSGGEFLVIFWGLLNGYITTAYERLQNEQIRVELTIAVRVVDILFLYCSVIEL